MAAASREEAADGSSQASQVVKARLSWWDWYLLKLDSQPLQTKCATSALLALLSNALSRRIEGQRIFDDFPAYAKNSFVAIIWRSPTLHYSGSRRPSHDPCVKRVQRGQHRCGCHVGGSQTCAYFIGSRWLQRGLSGGS
eukprot:TRINITY_DN18706_c0_g1_i3.p1 TRINITY_DN18706_c0_g1~~TRINITY_DN18706_c0_g1_i3.p1  ORF type:complete len:139 (+),score=16.20 TRINITY_DN18706_c0_g1_i3:55-471(+)